MSSYLKFLGRNKLYSIIEAVGLSVSLAFVVIIFCYVSQHIAVTRENPHRKEIYGVTFQNLLKFEYGMKETIGESIPEIEAVTEFGWVYDTEMKCGDQKRLVHVMGCDRDFFNMFPVQFAEGNPDQIDEAATAFVSKSLAQTLSESSDVVGQTIHVMKHDFTIVGVISDMGTSLFYNMPDVIVNVDLTDGVTFFGGLDSPARPANMFENVCLFVKTHPDADREAVSEKLASTVEVFYRKILGSDYPVDHTKVKLMRLDELFYSDMQTGLRKGDKVMMHSLLAIGLLLLISSMFNYWHSRANEPRRWLRGGCMVRQKAKSSGNTFGSHWPSLRYVWCWVSCWPRHFAR